MTGQRNGGRRGVSRREFGRRLAVASAAVAAMPGAIRATEPQPPSADGDTRIDAMWQSVLRKHGDRLTQDQKARLRKIITYNVRLLDAVAAFPLSNGDAPATTLRLVDGPPAARSVARPTPRRKGR